MVTFFHGKGGLWKAVKTHWKEFNKKLSNRKRETINDAFDTYVKDNFIRSSTIIESSIAKKGLEQFKKDMLVSDVAKTDLRIPGVKSVKFKPETLTRI